MHQHQHRQSTRASTGTSTSDGTLPPAPLRYSPPTHLDVAVRKQVLHQLAVHAAHAGVVDAKAPWQQVAQVAVLDRLRLSLGGR